MTKKLGVLKLGVEGMMLVGAVASFTAASVTGSIYLGFLLETPASLGQPFRSSH